ncbi:MAG: alpha-ketoglutarate-dependent dioxygenase AlkB family protein [Acidimicrobiales bacterium]
MVSTLQGSLFAAGEEVSPRAAAGRPARTPLDGGAWVEVRRGWLLGADALFERLRAGVAWRHERRPMYDRMVDVPRLQAFYDEDDPLPDPGLAEAMAALNRDYQEEMGEPLATVGLCCYRDGNDSVAWHGDTIGRGATCDTVVAICSLGCPRSLHLRPRRGGPALRFALHSGDLLVMGGSCQRTWEHAVPKTRRPVGPRISAQFRPRGVR